MKKQLLLLFCISLCTTLGFSQTGANYSITFTSNWSQTTHPHSSGSLPSNAHWSKLVGATHNDQVTFWEPGGTATPGVENIAEQGSNTAFFNEVDAAIASNRAFGIVDGDDLSTAEGQIVIPEVFVDDNFPLLTLLSMIAPSPDWMVGINSVSLQDSNGDWIDEIILEVYPYDAGTDSGVDYTSSNMDTNPQEPITSLQGVTPFSSEIIGTFTINLTSILGTEDLNRFETSIFPNPANNQVTITNESGLNSLEVVDVLGKVVLFRNNLNTQTTSLDITELSSGIYLLKIENNNSQFSVKRLIKR